MTRRPHTSLCLVPLALVPEREPAADPSLRPERIAQAKERINRGYYERAEVRRALVEAMLVEFAAP